MNCAENPKLLRAPDQSMIGDNNRLFRFELHRISSVSQEKKGGVPLQVGSVATR